MITRRDLTVMAITIVETLGVVAAAQDKPAIQGSTLFDWNAMTPTKTDVGYVRNVLRAPTATLDELEMHVTTLNPGLASHAPHQHENEELIIIREGTLEALMNGTWKRVGPGSVVFNASNVLHGIRNVGTTPAVYHVVNWKSKR
jgi:quercetin dioxygenase-like cupin family protein